MTKLAAPPVAATGTPTIAELLELPVLARGLPRVLTGQEQLDRPVRWVHVSEWHNPSGALRDGELVLTTGVGFPGRLDEYPAELADAGASGLVRARSRMSHHSGRSGCGAAVSLGGHPISGESTARSTM